MGRLMAGGYVHRLLSLVEYFAKSIRFFGSAGF